MEIPRDVLSAIREGRGNLRDEKLPFMVGGEHLVTLGAFEAVQEKYPEICIIHFDAHADLREDYLGEKLSECLRTAPLLGLDWRRKNLPVWYPLRGPGRVFLGQGTHLYAEV